MCECSSLKKLALRFVKIKEGVRWDNLQEFSYEMCSYMKCEGVIENVLAGAPNVEVLNLRVEDCRVKRYDIKSKSMKVLTVDFFVMGRHFDLEVDLVIDAPKLEILEISGIWQTKLMLNAPSLKTGIIRFANRNNVFVHAIRPVFVAFKLAFQSVSHVVDVTLNR